MDISEVSELRGLSRSWLNEPIAGRSHLAYNGRICTFLANNRSPTIFVKEAVESGQDFKRKSMKAKYLPPP